MSKKQGWSKEKQEKFPESWKKVQEKLGTLGKRWNLSEEVKREISKRKTGVKFSKLHKLNMSIVRAGVPHGHKTNNGMPAWNRGKSPSEKTRIKMSEARIRYIERGGLQKHMYNTKPELKMRELLDKLDVKYLFQKKISRYIVDFYIPSKNLIIEVDGEYWHNYPNGQEKDHTRDRELEMKGYNIKRFWAKEVFKLDCHSLAKHL